ncbi:sporulation membrane protein YtaF [Staphylospora marina]|uniref:sporulation membrane protein YtaF n=1 Tax=Staphylospora marina TaxID=2490858 RepID=UPI000F5BFF66|nr:sporulation membrane protein YtaF [Staphylospora marina]
MEHLLSMLWLALAVSMDGFGVGMTYGIRRMHIPLSSVLIIAMCSGGAVFAAMSFGNVLETWIPPETAVRLGAWIFIGLGCWAIVQATRAVRREGRNLPREAPSARIWTLRIPSLGLVIHILKEPMAADLDGSGSISGKEAVLLGSALALDSTGAGIGAAFVGAPALPVAMLVAAMSGLFLRAGMKWGGLLSGRKWDKAVNLLPGLILLLLGCVRLF